MNTGFDASLDVKSFEKETIVNGGESAVSVSVHSYNGSAKKLQVSRKIKNKDTGQLQFVKGGRNTKEEIQALSGLLSEAYNLM